MAIFGPYWAHTGHKEPFDERRPRARGRFDEKNWPTVHESPPEELTQAPELSIVQKSPADHEKHFDRARPTDHGVIFDWVKASGHAQSFGREQPGDHKKFSAGEGPRSINSLLIGKSQRTIRQPLLSKADGP